VLKLFIRYFFILIFIYPQGLLACPAGMSEDYSAGNAQRATTIVVGEVVKSEVVENVRKNFIITNVWIRGKDKKKFIVDEYIFGCGRSYEKGKEYIFLFSNTDQIGSLTYTKDNFTLLYNDINFRYKVY
jgi:hypothetical protein